MKSCFERPKAGRQAFRKMPGIIRFACVLTAALFLPKLVFGQSQFFLDNLESAHGVNAPVLDAAGNPLAGSTYAAELWGGAAPDSLSPALSAYSMERIIVPFVTRGYFTDSDPGGRGYPTIFSVLPTECAWLQVRAWDARLGATYENVVAAGLGGYGESPLFCAVGTYPFLPNPAIPGYLVGLQSFSLRAEVPEPSGWILFALGGFSLWWTLRPHRR